MKLELTPQERAYLANLCRKRAALISTRTHADDAIETSFATALADRFDDGEPTKAASTVTGDRDLKPIQEAGR